jgi:hypothetical protein
VLPLPGPVNRWLVVPGASTAGGSGVRKRRFRAFVAKSRDPDYIVRANVACDEFDAFG